MAVGLHLTVKYTRYTIFEIIYLIFHCESMVDFRKYRCGAQLKKQYKLTEAHEISFLGKYGCLVNVLTNLQYFLRDLILFLLIKGSYK